MLDRGFWWLLATNLAALALALWQRWPLGMLLFPYWLQSVLIGIFAWRRIRVTPDYRVGSVQFTINKRRFRREDWPQRRLARFFAMHFGLFHFVYMLFILGLAMHGNGVTTLDWYFAWAAALPLAISQARVHREEVREDRVHLPSTGALFLLPYLRVVPMHIGILVGGMLVGGGHAGWAIVVFGGLKTVFDLAGHLAERMILLGRRREAEARDAVEHDGGTDAVTRPARSPR